MYIFKCENDRNFECFFFLIFKADLDNLINVIRSGNAFSNNQNRKRRKPIQSTSAQYSSESLDLSRERIHSEN